MHLKLSHQGTSKIKDITPILWDLIEHLNSRNQLEKPF